MSDHPFPPLRPLLPSDADRRRRAVLEGVRRRRQRSAALGGLAVAVVIAAVAVPLSVAGGRPASEQVHVVQPGPGTSQPAPGTVAPAPGTSAPPTAPPATAPPTSAPAVAATTPPTSVAVATWRRPAVPAPVAGDTRAVLSAVTCPTAQRCLAVGGDPADVNPGLVLESDDGGATWAVRNRFDSLGVAQRPDLSGVTCPTATRCVAVGAGPTATGSIAAVAVVLTGPTSASTGAETVTLPPTMALATGVTCPTTSTCLVAGTGAGPDGGAQVARSTDGGASWSAVPAPAMADAWSVACSSATHCVLGGQTAGPTATSQAQASVSADGGLTWGHPAPAGTVSLVGLSCDGAACIGVDGTDGTDTAGQGTVVRSTDGGATWATVPGLGAGAVACAGTCALVGATFAPSTHTFPAAAESSVDGGATWRSLGPPASLQDLSGVAWAGSTLVVVGSTTPGGLPELATYGP